MNFSSCLTSHTEFTIPSPSRTPALSNPKTDTSSTWEKAITIFSSRAYSKGDFGGRWNKIPKRPIFAGRSSNSTISISTRKKPQKQKKILSWKNCLRWLKKRRKSKKLHHRRSSRSKLEPLKHLFHLTIKRSLRRLTKNIMTSFSKKLKTLKNC